MGFKLNDTIVSCADAEDIPPPPIVVSGSSITDRVILTQGIDCVVLDLSMLSDLVDLLRNKGVIK